MRSLRDLVSFKRKNTSSRSVPITPGVVECARCGWTMEGGTENQRLSAFMSHHCDRDHA